MSLYSIRAIIILDNTGERFVAKYFPSSKEEFESRKAQEEFEKKMFEKTSKSASEVVLFGNYLVLYQASADVIFYVVGPQDENELLLLNVLNTFKDAIDLLLRSQVDKRTLLENLDYVLLTIDELVDNGIFLESDPNEIQKRVSLKGAEEETPLTEQTLSEAWKTAKEQITKSFLSAYT